MLLPPAVARVFQDDPLPLLWTTKPSPGSAPGMRLRPLKPPPKPDEEVNLVIRKAMRPKPRLKQGASQTPSSSPHSTPGLTPSPPKSASPFGNDGGMGMFWCWLAAADASPGARQHRGAQGLLRRAAAAAAGATGATGAATGGALAPRPAQPAPRHRATPTASSATSATSEALVTPEVPRTAEPIPNPKERGNCLSDTFLNVLDRELRSVGLPSQLHHRISSAVGRSLNELLDAQQKDLEARLQAMLKKDQESEERFWMHASAVRKELHDREVKQAKESEARFWSHAGEVRKATYHQARMEASQVLQRAVVDGSLAEAIFSQVAKSSDEPTEAADRTSTETRDGPWHLLPSVGTWLNPAPDASRNLPAEVPEVPEVSEVLEVPAAYCYDNDHCDFVLCEELVDEMVEQVVVSSLSWVEAMLEAESEVHGLQQPNAIPNRLVLDKAHPEDEQPSERMPRLDPSQAREGREAEVPEEAVNQVAASLLSAARSGNTREGETAQAAEVMKQVAANLLQAARDGTLLRWQAEHLAQRLQRGSQAPGIGDLESPDGSERPMISRSSCSEVASIAVHDALEFAAKHLATLEDLRDDLSMSVALSQVSQGSEREWFLSEVAGEVTHQVMNALES
ncbi:unnamed protein product [Cladocopium goreaui]|uniref:Uncharacterized protein n=1 Tax=Cladocopium goreaui TaxID=2562237 RepID=A0A9P1GEB0_9DINO|nr:unnamed protein product [Cladocopium goreaui]